MRKIQTQPLTLDTFFKYGTFVNMINPTASVFGTPPVQFFRDMLPLDTQGCAPSFSICRVEPRGFAIEYGEYHNHSCEGILPLDGDVIIHVAVASGGGCPTNALEAFFVPRGTLVSLRPGVWHHAPFAIDGAVNTVIVLPERTYKNDCIVEKIEDCIEMTP